MRHNVVQVEGSRAVPGVSVGLGAAPECGVCDGGHPVAM